ncbi:MAG: hypothetical protein KF690_11725 [Bacteroidetes bacterium]|nr:hypothetical protein [Bacteroidota bacterium]
MNDSLTSKDLREFQQEFTDFIKNEISSLENGINARFDKVESRIHGVEVRLDTLEARVSGLESKVDILNVKVDGIETRLEAKIDQVQQSLNTIIEKNFLDPLKDDHFLNEKYGTPLALKRHNDKS